MRWICPRRSGPKWPETPWNRPQLGKANDDRRPSVDAPQGCDFKGAQLRAATDQYGQEVRVRAIERGTAGRPKAGPALGGREPYEGKLSRTVLRGARAGNRPRLPSGSRVATGR